MTDLPQRINVMRVLTYDVAGIVEQITADRDSEIVYDKDASKIKSKEILDFAVKNPDCVIPVKLTAVANVSVIDSNLKIVANVLTSGTYPLLGQTVDILQKYSEKVMVLRDLHTSGSLSDSDFKKSLLEMELS